MGQAKQRGTFEQRQRLALIRKAAEDYAIEEAKAARKIAEQERRSKMTEEELKKEKATVDDMNAILAMASLGLTNFARPIRRFRRI